MNELPPLPKGVYMTSPGRFRIKMDEWEGEFPIEIQKIPQIMEYFNQMNLEVIFEQKLSTWITPDPQQTDFPPFEYKTPKYNENE